MQPGNILELSSPDTLIPSPTANMLIAPSPESRPSGFDSCLGLKGGFEEVCGLFKNIRDALEGQNSPQLL